MGPYRKPAGREPAPAPAPEHEPCPSRFFLSVLFFAIGFVLRCCR